MNTKEFYRFKKQLKELRDKKGSGTELVTVLVPAGYELSKTINKLKEEQGTASNIKSKRTRKNVVDALERIVQHLKLFKRTPETGLAVFCGNVSERTDKPDIQLYSIIPPEPLKEGIYRCSQEFMLEPLEVMGEEKDVYGLLVMDRREANIAYLRGKRIDKVKRLTSAVPGKFRAGGQSAQRFERTIENMAKDFYKEIGESCNEIFDTKLKGIIIGGPGPTKRYFVDGSYLRTELNKKIVAVLDIGYSDEYGLEELVDRTTKVLKEADFTKEKELVQKFLTEATTGSLAAYGMEEIRNALNAGAVDTLLLSEKLEPALIEEMIEEAEKTGVRVEIISMDTREGQQLAELTGIAALLRYKYRQK